MLAAPPGFIDFVTNEARRWGWPDSQIHSERFDADVNKAGKSFEGVAARSRQSFVIPADQTIAEVLLTRQGLDVSVACEQCICGTCICDVLEGIPIIATEPLFARLLSVDRDRQHADDDQA